MITLPPDRKEQINGYDREALNAAIADRGRQVQQLASGDAAQPIFDAYELEQVQFRRFNPYAALTAVSLASALDAYEAGEIASAARLWARIAKSDPTINTVKPKREESVSLRGISTRPKDDSPLAKDQAAALQSFYDNARASHATKRHVTGKASLLLEQMMESVAFEFACHHIIWEPDAMNVVALPSGKVLPSLGATFEYVPLEFFEARTGVLRFLGVNNFYNGRPLEDFGDWLITTGPGLMFCASILHYFARLARHDMVNFAEKFGSPGILVHVTAQQGTPEGAAALALSKTLASNYRGVLYGAAENKAEYLWPQGGPGGGDLPMHVLTSDIKQELIAMWMGADLSTLSRGNDVTGASVQGEDQEKKERKDCRRISDTLNAQVDPVVLRWFFGANTPLLAEAFIDYPTHEDSAKLVEAVRFAVDAGAEVPIEPVLKRLNVPVAKEGEETFEKAAPAPLPGFGAANPGSALNVALNARADLEQFLGEQRDAYIKAFANDLQPLRIAMEAVLSPDDFAFNAKVAWLRSQLPALLKEIAAAPKTADALEQVLRTAFANGYEKAAKERKAL